jgi:osmoprotectant transport system substrate-binding protein
MQGAHFMQAHPTRRLCLIAIAAAASARAVRADTPVRVGSKPDTEGALLGNIIIRALEAKGIRTQNRIGLGPTQIIRGAILADQVDIYPEYTGNGAFFFNMDSDPAWKNAQAGYEKIRALDTARNKLVWLPPAPANNSWAIALHRGLAESQHLRTMEDLARYINGGGSILLAASAEFVESPAALPAFEAAYGFKLRGGQILMLAGGNTAVTIRAAAEGTSGVNAAMAYGTDGALAALGLRVLDDDRAAQLIFAPAPVVRQAVLTAHPEIVPALAPAFASLDAPTLRQLNRKIAVDGDDAAQVAADYLRSQALIE